MEQRQEPRWIVARLDGEEPYTPEDLPRVTVPLYSFSYAGFREALKGGLLSLEKQGVFKKNRRRPCCEQNGLDFSARKRELGRNSRLPSLTLGGKQTASSIDGGAPKARRSTSLV